MKNDVMVESGTSFGIKFWICWIVCRTGCITVEKNEMIRLYQ